MTTEEINKIFPENYNGAALISDLRLLLSHVVSLDDIDLDGIKFTEVNTIDQMYALEKERGDICKVWHSPNGYTKTYIFDGNNWRTLVEASGGGSGTTYPKKTETFICTSDDEVNQEISLTYEPLATEHLFVFVNGVYMSEGPTFDFTRSQKTISFFDAIVEGDIVTVKYAYDA